MKTIQVFLSSSPHMAEISATLIKIKYAEGGVFMTTKEEDSLTIHFFPYSAINMLRIWEEGQDD